MLFNRFPVEYQMDSQDCGPASLKVIAKHFGKFYSLQYLRDRCGITKEGVSLLDLSTGAESIGLRTLAIKCTVDDVVNSIPFPAIVFWNDNHFVVAYAADRKHIWVSDPAKGRVKYTHGQFRKGWYRKDEKQGVLLAVEPAADFKDSKAQREQRKNSFSGILKYFLPYKNNFTLVFIIMLVVTLLQGVLPFISKAVIDVGIKTSDVNFINMVLIGNISILLSVMVFNVLRDWILMHVTSRVNIALISDYLIKLMKLPVTFFENKLLGDILQRAQDHERIRSFIMNNSLALVFSA
ncbi:ATP-binding cassette, subfamily B, partial [Porphyromonadaceae bacterium KH3CP3RA]